MFDDIKESLFGSEKEEKKVEYIELVYDLIFVYLIGRNSSLMHLIQDGFIIPHAFLTYLVGTLVIIQIWNYTTFYINRYGSNGFQDHMLMLVNMFLLYFMADAIRADWANYYFYKYNIAWVLILINILVHYWIKYRRFREEKPWEALQMTYTMIMLAVQTVIVIAAIVLYSFTGLSLTFLGVAFGVIYTIAASRINTLVPVDFGHLTERAMLYVVFTFGEMIIAISGYFEGEVNLSGVYFALMGFLIVVGLFQSYELCYDHLIDRGLITSGSGYMMIHLFLILALSNITVALEFMRREEVDLLPKTMFLAGSFVVYYVFLYLLAIYSKTKARPSRKFIAGIIVLLAAFAVLMVILREYMYVNIALTVALVFANLWIILKAKKAYDNACCNL